MASARQAASSQDQLANEYFTIDDNEDSKEFRMLIPLGFQFEADMLRSIILDESANAALGDPIVQQDVVNAFDTAVNTPPLNTSRESSR